MVELFILWNVAAARADGGQDNDFSSGAIGVWIVLQILIWPLSMFLLLWQRFGLRWYTSLIVASAFTLIGFLLWADSFYYVVGMVAAVVAACVVANEVVSNS
jgi:hypothetical protein